MITGRTYFTGGGGADIGMMAAGVKMVDGVEYIQEIGEWAKKQLGHNVRIESVLDIDPRDLEPTTCFHASPPCPSFSRANPNSKENKNDIALANKISDYLKVHHPKIVTMENVWQWRTSESWRIISSTLDELYGFAWDVNHLNSADFGVPQSRKRMIVRAVKGVGYLPAYPPAEKWVGWYEAVEDIIDTFPESQFPPWLVKRLPKEFKTMLVSGENSTSNGKKHQDKELPAFTISTSPSSKAFLMSTNNKTTKPRLAEDPAQTTRATRTETSRAFLVEPAVGGNREAIIRGEGDPAFTAKSGSGGRLGRAYLDHGKIVQITIRGLARFQSFPDWYKFPEKKTLANTIIGNSVPPLMMEKIYKQLLEV